MFYLGGQPGGRFSALGMRTVACLGRTERSSVLQNHALKHYGAAVAFQAGRGSWLDESNIGR